MADRRRGAGGGILVVDHVPYGPICDRHIVYGTIHADRDRAASAPRPGDATTYTGNAEVIAQHRNPCFSHVPDDRLDVFDLLGAPRPIQQDVVPDGRIEIFDGFEGETGILNLTANSSEFPDRPELVVGISRQSPISKFAARRLVVARVRVAIAKVVDEMNHKMRATRLPREVIRFARQHMPIETQADFHIPVPRSFPYSEV